MSKEQLDAAFVLGLIVTVIIAGALGPLIFRSSRRVGSIDRPQSPVLDPREEYERVWREAQFLTHRPETTSHDGGSRERSADAYGDPRTR